MIKEGINGFCMALADSVPGVSGGTVAFIMGFYDRFIRSIHNLVFGKRESKTESLRYLIKLGIGWAIGMISAVLVLSALFENHIYTVSSLFIGFIAGAIPLIIKEEKDSIRQAAKGMIFCVIGMAAISAMFLPGISGSTLLLIFGAYIPVITAVRGFLGLDLSVCPESDVLRIWRAHGRSDRG